MNYYTKQKEYSDISILYKNSPKDDSITMQNVIDRNKNKNNNITEGFKFANGDKLSFEDIKKLSLIGSDSSENIVGYVHANNIIKGGGGDDKLYGQGWDDTIYGGDGNDLIESGSGNDTLIEGEGNDTLIGGAKDDTYIFNKGDGNDIIEDVGGVDTLKFGEGIFKEDVIVSISKNPKNYGYSDMTIQFKNSSTDSITLKNVIKDRSTNYDYVVNDFEFFNGDKLTFNGIKRLYLIGTDNNDKLYGYNDMDSVIKGNKGDDTLNGGESE